MADKDQARGSPEKEISVDLNAADESKAVTRRSVSDIARAARDDEDKPRTRAEKDLFKRMSRLERNLERQFTQREAETEARHQRELSELRARVDRVSLEGTDSTDKVDAAHETAMNALKEKLAAAYERGDSVASADITREMSTLDAKYWAKKASAAGVTTRESAASPGAAAKPVANTGPTAAGARFIRANEDWWDEPEFIAEKAAANALYWELVNSEGFDAKDDETYKEVAKRMKAKFPALAVRPGRRGPDDDDDEDDDARQETRQQRRAPTTRMEDRGGAATVHRGADRRTLTPQERKTMIDCRLDPDNDRDVVQFVREAAAFEAAQ